MLELVGARQRYAWGSSTSIPDLIGVAPDDAPWAELWFGTHSAGRTLTAGGSALDEVIEPLPYLVKLLAADRPLSLQTHPSAAQASSGFEQGIFGDPYAKPEVLIALTPFEALSGFRPFAETERLLRSWGLVPFAFENIIRQPVDPSMFEVLRRIEHPLARWACALHEQYPHDPAAAAVLVLNYVTLQPGEAIYLDAGNVHAYLRGTGLEVMGASDNVVRGGLTSKAVDIDLLLAITDVSPLADPRARCIDGVYETLNAPFTVRRVGSNGMDSVDFSVSIDPVTRAMRIAVAGQSFTVTPL